MRIDVNQWKISIGDKYQIFIDGQPAYKASSELVKLLSVIDLYRGDSPKPVLTISKRWSIFKPVYDIRLHDRQTVQFEARTFWDMEYKCHCSPDMYYIYGHRGRKFSVYRNNTQVAWWEKERVTWFDGDNYCITADSDCNVELIVAFCLILDNHRSKKHGNNAISYNIGNIGGETKAFNPYWKPK